MGDVIRNSAAVGDIFDDLRASLRSAVAKGGVVRSLAEEYLGATASMIGTIEQDLNEARVLAAPLIAELAAENDRADALLDRICDDLWNEVGRPANDRMLALLFPGGAGYYTDGDTEEQPDRMELLAELLDRKLHPKLTAEKAADYATKIREAARGLAEDAAAARMPAARVKLLERVRTALGRSAQFDLASLKRAYKNERMSEAEIHTIIPDRPPAKKKAPK
jgi:hypothetical protein